MVHTRLLVFSQKVWYKVRHDTTGFVSNVFVGRLIPSESRTRDENQTSFPPPLDTHMSPAADAAVESADSGAGHMDMSDRELSDDEKVQSGDEEQKWEEPLVFPAPLKPPPKKGKGKRAQKVLVQSDKADLWPKFSDSAVRRRRGFTAESTGDLTFVIKKRPRPIGAKGYWSLPQGPGLYYTQIYGACRESRRAPLPDR